MKKDSLVAVMHIRITNTNYKSETNTKHIPVSKQKFEEKRDFLLSLLPSDQMSDELKESITTLKTGELLQNIPNPFSGATKIWYKLENESNVQLNVYSYTGQLIKSLDEGVKTKGSHCIEFDASGLKNGIYFYSININGKTTDSKKMTILK